jgi:hypothetical protein
MQVDVEQGRQQPQIRGDRGLEGEQVQDPPLDLQVERIHLIVAADHFLTQAQVPVGKGP